MKYLILTWNGLMDCGIWACKRAMDFCDRQIAEKAARNAEADEAEAREA